MSTSTNSQRLVVLIDAENAQVATVDELFAEVAKYGTPNVRRAYGNFADSSLSNWSNVMVEHSIQASHQLKNTSRKNGADIALVIDAMDLLHSGRFDGFCIVSSDSDYTALARRIREEGALVYGFGEEKTPRSLVTACDKFVYTENLKPKTGGLSDASPSSRRLKKVPSGIIRDAVEAAADESGWADLARVGQMLGNRLPDFDCRTYGHSSLTALIGTVDGLECERRGAEGGPQQVFARIRIG